MTLRTAHGTARDNGASIVVEQRPLDEIPPPNAQETANRLAERRVRGRPFKPGNRAAVGRPPALCVFGMRIDAQDPEYRKALRKANSYRRRRVSELTVAYGYVSAGAAGMVASASLALGGSRYLYELAGRNGDTSLIAQAARLAESAKQLEIAAMDVAQREAAARPRDPGDAHRRAAEAFAEAGRQDRIRRGLPPDPKESR